MLDRRNGSKRLYRKVYRIETERLYRKVYRIETERLYRKVYRIGTERLYRKVYRIGTVRVYSKLYRIGTGTVYRIGTEYMYRVTVGIGLRLYIVSQRVLVLHIVFQWVPRFSPMRRNGNRCRNKARSRLCVWQELSGNH